jgi:ketosteroid isomerase-like protein
VLTYPRGYLSFGVPLAGSWSVFQTWPQCRMTAAVVDPEYDNYLSDDATSPGEMTLRRCPALWYTRSYVGIPCSECMNEMQLPMANDHQQTIALQFNECINTRDLDGLAGMLGDEHTFIDSANTRVHGKERVVAAWRGFFARFPDYRNIFEWVESRDQLVAIMGRSVCSEPQLDGPALWTAKVQGDQVVEWRVYKDTPENRTALGFT